MSREYFCHLLFPGKELNHGLRILSDVKSMLCQIALQKVVQHVWRLLGQAQRKLVLTEVTSNDIEMHMEMCSSPYVF
jgi:hypothetical protein